MKRKFLIIISALILTVMLSVLNTVGVEIMAQNTSGDTNSGTPGDGSLTPPESENWTLYFPVRVGNYWVYQTSDADKESPEITINVAGKSPIEGVECYVFETFIGETLNRREYFEVRPDSGIYSRKREVLTENTLKEFYPQPPDLVLKFPLKIGASWEWEDNSMKKLKGFNIFEITGYETIKTPTGEYKSFKLEIYQENSRGDRFKTIRWYAKNVGMVKEFTRISNPAHPMDSTPGITFELKEYKIGETGGYE